MIFCPACDTADGHAAGCVVTTITTPATSSPDEDTRLDVCPIHDGRPDLPPFICICS